MKSKPTWFRMSAENGVGVINIFGDIGSFGITFEDFQRELDRLGSVSELRMMMNSDGGDVFAGFAIYNALQLHPAQKTITVMGLAASIASVILMAADKRIMPGNAMIMIHNPVGAIVGEADELVSYGEAVAQMRAKIAQAYVDASGGKLSTKSALGLMDKQTWIGAERAVELGLADEIAQPIKIAAKFDLSAKYQNAPPELDARRDIDSLTASVSETDEANTEDSAMTTPAPKTADATTASTATSDAVASAVTAERDRIRHITAACKMAGHADKADGFVSAGKSLAEVIAALDALPPKAVDSKTADGKTAADVELSARHGAETESPVVVLDEAAIWARWNKTKAA